VGPDRVGSAVTYRLTLSGSPAGNAAVQTPALHWKLGQKVTVTLTGADEAQAMLLVATRAPDSALTLDNVSAGDIEGQTNRDGARLVRSPRQLRRLGTERRDGVEDGNRRAPTRGSGAARAGRAEHANPAAANDPRRRNAQRRRNRHEPRGFRLDQSHRAEPGRIGARRREDGRCVKVTTTITVAARFNRDGELMSGTIDETNQAADDQSPSSPGGQPATLSWQIERVQ